ncbi:hypothetical protein LINPERPRIM_LOCUS34046 [Linum perenne]
MGHSLYIGFQCIEVNSPSLSYWLLYDQLNRCF